MISARTIKKYIKEDRINDISFNDLVEICKNPGEYGLTFGEVGRLTGELVAMAEKVNAVTTNHTDDNRLDKLEEHVSVALIAIRKLNEKVNDAEDFVQARIDAAVKEELEKFVEYFARLNNVCFDLGNPDMPPICNEVKEFLKPYMQNGVHTALEYYLKERYKE